MTKEELGFKREQAIKLYKKGYSRLQIRDITELGKSTIDHLIADFKKNGEKVVSLCKRGRKVGEKRKLTVEQEKIVQKALIDKDPNQYKLSCCVWDRVTVCALIEQLFGIKLPVSTMGYYFQRWGFTAQRPNLTNYKQNPKHVAKWLENEYPAIKKQAQNEDAEILWGDETAVQNECNYVKSYAPIGQTPTLKTKGERLKINMISAVSNRGKVRFMFYEESMTSQRFIAFMERLIRFAKRKIIFIVDNLKVHHSKKVMEWLSKHKDKIEVRYLPSYSPELNPDEYLNGNLKRELSKRKKVDNVDSLHENAKSIMRTFASNKKHAISWFENKNIAYAA